MPPPGSSRPAAPAAGRPARRTGFTILELLVVIGIMVTMMALLVPAFNGIKGSGDATKAVYDIKGFLDQARTYAIANNTYVWVGFSEENVASTTAASPGIGRVALAAVAARDGTRGYDPASPPATLTSANLTAISKLQKWDNLHLVSLNGFANQGAVTAIPSSSGMARPVVLSNNYDIGNSACVSCTTFAWPPQGTAHYTFSKVINFDPRGAARIQYAGNSDFIPLYMEVGLQSTHGNIAPAAPTVQNKGNHAAIQIDGMTGATRIYRP